MFVYPYIPDHSRNCIFSLAYKSTLTQACFFRAQLLLPQQKRAVLPAAIFLTSFACVYF